MQKIKKNNDRKRNSNQSVASPSTSCRAEWSPSGGIRRAGPDECIALLATIEPKVTCPERRLFVQLESHPLEISKHYGVYRYQSSTPVVRREMAAFYSTEH